VLYCISVFSILQYKEYLTNKQNVSSLSDLVLEVFFQLKFNILLKRSSNHG
jgi:hypothetical protein